MVESLGVTTENFTFDNLLTGNTSIEIKEITLESGQNLARGALLGEITASSKHVLSLSASADGSEDPDAILARDTDASAGDVKTVAYIKGSFNENGVTFGTGHTKASTEDALRDLGIYIKSAQAE